MGRTPPPPGPISSKADLKTIPRLASGSGAGGSRPSPRLAGPVRRLHAHPPTAAPLLERSLPAAPGAAGWRGDGVWKGSFEGVSGSEGFQKRGLDASYEVQAGIALRGPPLARRQNRPGWHKDEANPALDHEGPPLPWCWCWTVALTPARHRRRRLVAGGAAEPAQPATIAACPMPRRRGSFPRTRPLSASILLTQSLMGWWPTPGIMAPASKRRPGSGRGRSACVMAPLQLQDWITPVSWADWLGIPTSLGPDGSRGPAGPTGWLLAMEKS